MSAYLCASDTLDMKQLTSHDETSRGSVITVQYGTRTSTDYGIDGSVSLSVRIRWGLRPVLGVVLVSYWYACRVLVTRHLGLSPPLVPLTVALALPYFIREYSTHTRSGTGCYKYACTVPYPYKKRHRLLQVRVREYTRVR